MSNFLKKVFTILFVFALTLNTVESEASVPFSGTFKAKDNCEAFLNIREVSSAESSNLKINEYYEVTERSLTFDKWIQIRIDGELKWVKENCGTFQISSGFVEKLEPFFQSEFNDFFPAPPILNEFDAEILKVCGNWGDIVSKESRLLGIFKNEDFAKYSEYIFDSLDGKIGKKKYENKDKFFRHFVNVWTKENGFTRIFCGIPKKSRLEGLNYAGRFLQMQENGWGGALPNCKENESIKGVVYTQCVKFQTTRGTFSIKKSSSYSYAHQNAEELLSLITHAYNKIGGKNRKCYFPTFISSGQVFFSLLSVKNDSISKSYPDLTPTDTFCYFPDATDKRFDRSGLSYTKGTKRERSSDLKLHFIDVGQGDSTILECPNGNIILVDAGSLQNTPLINNLTKLYGPIFKSNFNVINSLVITHPDKDHYNLLEQITAGVKINEVFHVGNDYDYIKKFRLWLKSLDADIHYLTEEYYDTAGEPNQLLDCGDAEVYVLAANVSSKVSKKNAKSIVLMVRYGEFEAILTGDATFSTEKVITDRYSHSPSWLDVDVLKVGHHGSRATSTSQEWVQLLSPSIAIVSAGDNNSFGHPLVEVINRLTPIVLDYEEHSLIFGSGIKSSYKWHNEKAFSKAIFNTASSGSISLTIAKGGKGIKLHERNIRTAQ